MPGKTGRRVRCGRLLRHLDQFSFWGGRVELRPYQLRAIEAVLDSIRRRLGLTFVWIFPRQSGKDESIAIMVCYLLTHTSKVGGEIVLINPTFKPQTETSMRRLEARLKSNALTRGRWKRRSGYVFQIGNSNATYMSADPNAHIVGATANVLLAINEAQDISPFKYDKDLDPMVASTNATKLFSGTRWASDTLLERELQRAQAAEAGDGIKRVFFYTAEDVRLHVPAYGRHVDGVIARMGRQHPLVKTQYFCEAIDAQAGMFPAGRQALMYGAHSAQIQPRAGKMYAFLVDVAGQDEALTRDDEFLDNPGRDSTFLKIVEVDLASVELLGKPTYKTIFRCAWQGEKHVTVFGALRALAAAWRPRYVVIDATGVGEGLWSLLDNALGPETVLPVKFTPQVKSELGYGFLAIVESGRYQEYSPFDETLAEQMDKCRSEIVPGPAKLMRWGVPDGTRGQAGELVHDDDLITSALCVVLDRMEWFVPLKSSFVPFVK